jgi:hypothetical protein
MTRWFRAFPGGNLSSFTDLTILGFLRMTMIPPDRAWTAIMSEPEPAAAIYRQEAARLRDVADHPDYRSVRDNLLDIARQYDVLAAQAGGILSQSFARSFGRRPFDRTR